MDFLDEFQEAKFESLTLTAWLAKDDKEDYFKPPIGYFLKQPVILANLLIMALSWLMVSFVYYMTNLYVRFIPGDIFTHIYIFATGDILGPIFCAFFVLEVGAKITLLGGNALVALSALVIIIWGSSKAMVMNVALFCLRLAVDSSFNVVYIATSMVFPTLF